MYRKCWLISTCPNNQGNSVISTHLNSLKRLEATVYVSVISTCAYKSTFTLKKMVKFKLEIQITDL